LHEELTQQSQGSGGKEEETAAAKAKGLHVIRMEVVGMKCRSCAGRITTAVCALSFVCDVFVDVPRHLVHVLHFGAIMDDVTATVSQLAFTVEKVDEIPYSLYSSPAASLSSSSSSSSGLVLYSLSVLGMTCNSCTSLIESCISSLPQITSVTVSLEDKEARIVAPPGQSFAEEIESLGFTASLISSQPLLFIGWQLLRTLPPSKAKAFSAKFFQGVPGVIHADVHPRVGLMLYVTRDVDYDALVRKIEDEKLEGNFRFPVTLQEAIRLVEEEEREQQRLDALLDRGRDDVDGFAAQYATSSAADDEVIAMDVAEAPLLSHREVHTKLSIFGMHCSSCVNRIQTHLLAIPGVTKAVVSLLSECGEVTHSEDVLPQRICEEVESLGFEVKLNAEKDGECTLLVTGMTCSSCVGKIESQLRSTLGVHSANVNLITEQATVRFDPHLIGLRGIVQIIKDMGYSASVVTQGLQANRLKREGEQEYYWRKFLISLFFSIPAFFFGMAMMWIDEDWIKQTIVTKPHLTLEDIIMFSLATPVQFILGYGFYKRTFAALRHGMATMDTLVSLATSVGYFYSVGVIVYGMFDPTFMYHLFFEAGIMLMSFIFLGHYLQSRTKGQTSEAIQALLNLQPPTARLLIPHLPSSSEAKEMEKAEANSAAIAEYREEVIDSNLLERGDLVKIVPGDKVPADGTVFFGNTYVDESMMTGESAPVKKEVTILFFEFFIFQSRLVVLLKIPLFSGGI
jgi:Cu+-exporting ATPase